MASNDKTLKLLTCWTGNQKLSGDLRLLVSVYFRFKPFPKTVLKMLSKWMVEACLFSQSDIPGLGWALLSKGSISNPVTCVPFRREWHNFCQKLRGKSSSQMVVDGIGLEGIDWCLPELKAGGTHSHLLFPPFLPFSLPFFPLPHSEMF